MRLNAMTESDAALAIASLPAAPPPPVRSFHAAGRPFVMMSPSSSPQHISPLSGKNGGVDQGGRLPPVRLFAALGMIGVVVGDHGFAAFSGCIGPSHTPGTVDGARGN